ncbi:uncharacterized protein LOC134845567 isoform X2 [Symsagittifera roscoffensis]|uniref:uncharacterized protein LOC134845567 isoform X2 n=1 Tax=Symsagittifera roscoffensis TaxID=84072 RepID=UPI00307C5627
MECCDIDTKAQSFVAEVLIEATWVSDRDDGECGSNGDKDDFDPKLVITNLEETRKETQWRSCEQDPDDPDVTYITMHWRIKGVFYENMELENFPRDVQDISISVSSDWHANEIELMLDYSKMSTLDVANFQDDQEWSLFKHVELEKVPEDPESEIELGYTAGFIVARCRVARRSKFFMVNNVLLMFSLIVLSLTIFAYDPSWNMARISSSMTLLLVAVAFKLSVAGTLPLISYLTYLDIYILGGMLFLCSMTVIFALISPFKDKPDEALVIDMCALVALAVLITVFHVVYAVVFLNNTNKRINEMKKKDKEYDLQLRRHREMEKMVNMARKTSRDPPTSPDTSTIAATTPRSKPKIPPAEIIIRDISIEDRMSFIDESKDRKSSDSNSRPTVFDPNRSSLRRGLRTPKTNGISDFSSHGIYSDSNETRDVPSHNNNFMNPVGYL